MLLVSQYNYNRNPKLLSRRRKCKMRNKHPSDGQEKKEWMRNTIEKIQKIHIESVKNCYVKTVSPMFHVHSTHFSKDGKINVDHRLTREKEKGNTLFQFQFFCYWL